MTIEPTTLPVPTSEELQQLVLADRQRRRAACQAEIQASCERHGFTLSAVPQYTADGRTVAAPVLLPLEGQ